MAVSLVNLCLSRYVQRAGAQPGGDDLMAYLLDAIVFIQAKNLRHLGRAND